MSMTIQSSVKDKILATPSETSKYEYEIRYHPGKANVVIDALRRKEQVKPRRVRAMDMTIQYGEWNSGDDQLRLRWMIYLMVLADTAESVSDAIRFEYCLTSSSDGQTEPLYGRKCRSPVLWAEIGESSLIGPKWVQETTDKVVLIKGKLSIHTCSLSKGSLRVLVEVGFLMSFLDDWRGSGSGCFFWFGAVMLLCVPFCGQAKLLSVRYLVRVSWNSKCNFELTWVWEDYLKDKFGNQSIERDRLIGIGFVLDFVEFISFTFGDKEMILWFKRFSDLSCELNGAKIERSG
ncbi:hypothetical protein Tco_0307072 [Tanacetum coccineum]